MCLFQSTHSVGSGTFSISYNFGCILDFNPPTPWGVGRIVPRKKLVCGYFNPPTPWGVGLFRLFGNFLNQRFQSTHSVGSGTVVNQPVELAKAFQSTHSVGSGTQRLSIAMEASQFQSTHSVGSGTESKSTLQGFGNFNPPTPWGVGLFRYSSFAICKPFQSTHSVGSGTTFSEFGLHIANISIHPLRGEWDNY